MTDREEPYTCLECNWSGLEPIGHSGESKPSFFRDKKTGELRRNSSNFSTRRDYHNSETNIVCWNNCPECNGLVMTETQRNWEKTQLRFAVGILAAILIGIFYSPT
jgi:hypothetical protein